MDQMKKEELEITISDSDRIENAIRHIQTAVDIDPWAVEIAVEAMKAQLSREDTTSDLISRREAIDALHTWFRDGFDEDRWWNSTHVLAALEGLPSAQPEIIRCKDCENWIPGYITDNDDFIPPKCGKYQQMVGHSSDDYCSLAERRTDDQSK